MRDAQPVSGVPAVDRYSESRDLSRGEAGQYNHLPFTLEEEAYNGGWTPRALPSGSKPNDAITIGMRGEPDWDDDPQFVNGRGTVTHPPAK